MSKGSWLFILPCSIKHLHSSLWSVAVCPAMPIPCYGSCGLLASGFKHHPLPRLCYFRVSWPPWMITSPALWWPLQPSALTCRELPPHQWCLCALTGIFPMDLVHGVSPSGAQMKRQTLVGCLALHNILIPVRLRLSASCIPSFLSCQGNSSISAHSALAITFSRLLRAIQAASLPCVPRSWPEH